MERLPGLVVDIEARIDKLEKGLAKANRAQGTAATQMERRAKQSADQIGKSYGSSADKIAASFATLGKRIVPFVGAVAAAGAGAIATIDRVAKSIADTGDAARRAGLDFDAFQRLDFVARQNRIGVDQLVDGIKELQLRADELIQTGGGAGAEAFQRLGLSADDLKRKLDDPSDLFLEIIGRLEDLDRAAQIRIADEIFGGSAGERFVEIIAQGEDKLRATAHRADELGLVLSDDVLRRAEEVNAKFEEIRARVETLGKTIVVNVAGAIEDALTIDLDDIFGSAERAISVLGEETYRNMQGADALDAQRAEVEELIDVWEELRTAIGAATSIDSGVRLMDMADIDAAYELAGILTDIDAAMIAFDNGATSADDFTVEMGELINEAEAVTTALAEIDGTRFGGVIAAIGGISTALSTAIQRAATLAATLPGEGPLEPLATGPQNGRGRGVNVALRPGEFAPTTSPRPRLPGVDASFGAPEPEEAKRGGGGGAPKTDDYQREVERIREVAAELEQEALALTALTIAGNDYAAAIDEAENKARLLAAALRAGRADTPELRAEIDKAAAAHRKQAEAVDLVRDRLDAAEEARERLVGAGQDAFAGLLKGTLTWRDALMQVIDTLADLAIDNLANGLFNNLRMGASGGPTWLTALGKLFGFSGGGWTGPGGKYEAAGIVHRDEYVFSKEATRAIGVDNLDAMHRAAQRGFAAGGYVGNAPAFTRLPAPAPATGQGEAASIQIHAPVTVNGSAGSPEQNADLARQMAREMEGTMRGVVVDELRRQMRPGNIMSRR